MVDVIFLGGLGSNRHHAKDLQEKLNLDMTILELPGHGDEFNADITNLDTFLSWFETKIISFNNVVLIAHSMGANFAPYLAVSCPKIQQVILLEGGYIDFDQLMTLEDELQDTKNYFEQMIVDNIETLIEEEKNTASYWSKHMEQAVRESFSAVGGQYRLALKEETTLLLLALQRQASGYLTQVNCPTLLIPQTNDETPTWKKDMLAKVPKHIAIDSSLMCGHSPHSENPQAIATRIQAFLNSKKKLGQQS